MNKEKIISHFGKVFYQKVLHDLEKYVKLWDLSGFEQVDYYSVNCLFKCHSPKFGACILKIGNSCKETQTEYAMLQEYNGSCFCRVYEADIASGILLIEQIIPGIQLRAEKDIKKRINIFCDIFKGLHKKPYDKSIYPAYMGWVSRIAAYMRVQKDYSTLSAHMSNAEQICCSLCEKYSGEMLLHGDLHHDNILLGSDKCYRIIDPKGVMGDCVFDIPRFILNEFEDEIPQAFNEKFRFITKSLYKKLSIPEVDIRKLVYVEMCLANSWNVESKTAPNMQHVDFAKEMMNEI
jgi:streptomycin 6-kinase